MRMPTRVMMFRGTLAALAAIHSRKGTKCRNRAIKIIAISRKNILEIIRFHPFKNTIASI